MFSTAATPPHQKGEVPSNERGSKRRRGKGGELLFASTKTRSAGRGTGKNRKFLPHRGRRIRPLQVCMTIRGGDHIEKKTREGKKLSQPRNETVGGGGGGGGEKNANPNSLKNSVF